jgi:L-lactate dehydrogenase complex protein LldE
MKIALHVPCYINELNPEIAKKTLLILRYFKLNVTVPKNQTCCGQPFINSGHPTTLPNQFNEIFKHFDYIVSPSSSCVSTLRAQNLEVSTKTYELCEFLHDVVGVDNLQIDSKLSKSVGLHNSCHGLRELKLASASELNIPHYNKIKAVLSKIDGIDIVEANRDECCGFGGTFAVSEPDISVMMGRDRIDDHKSNGVDIVCGVDMSCLMHMNAIAKKDGTDMRFVHIAQLLNGDV